MPASSPGDPPGPRRASTLWPWLVPGLAGLAFSALMTLAFAPFGLWCFVFVAPLPLVWYSVRRARHPTSHGPGPVTSAALASLGAMALWACELVWTFDISVAGYWPLIAALAVFQGLFAWLVSTATRWVAWLPLSLIVPLAWTGIEFARGEVVFSGFPWLLLAHPTIDAPVLPFTASILGTYFTSFLVAMVSGIAADLFLAPQRRVIPAATGFGVFALAVVLAQVVGRGGSGGVRNSSLRVAVVQTNVPQDNKMDWEIEQRLADFERFKELTRAAASSSPPPDLIVWPETMFPGEFLDPESVEAQRSSGLFLRTRRPGAEPERVSITRFADELLALQSELGIPMLVGAMAATNLEFLEHPEGGYYPRYDARYNTAFLIEQGRVCGGRYDKIDLTPFGEVMPYISSWPWLEKQFLAIGASGMAFDLVPGTQLTQFEVTNADGRPVRFVTPICFEAMRQRICRSLVYRPGQRADLMINLTNDGWFGWFDPARRHHLQIARWRCIELGVPMVRAANTGISAHIDRDGNVVNAGVEPARGSGGGAARVDGILISDVNLTHRTTIFARVGVVFGWSMLAGTLLLAVESLRQWLRARRALPPKDAAATPAS